MEGLVGGFKEREKMHLVMCVCVCARARPLVHACKHMRCHVGQKVPKP
jgi:hypothetical protein